MEEQSYRGPGLLALALVLLFGLAALYIDKTPSPRGLEAPEDTFSAQRAFAHLEAFASSPRTVGSRSHAEARAYLVEELEALGLEVRVASTLRSFGAQSTRLVVPVTNIVAVMKGTRSTNQILVAAHYDTRANTPGAADDGAGVVAILETIRALRAGEPPENDLVFLLSDAEEIGLLGAEFFVEEDPIADEIDLVMNFEARGVSGPVIMFETTPKSNRVIDALDQTVPNPVATSLAYEIYKVMPNDTDFTHFKEMDGVEGLNFALIGEPNRYHSAGDTPEALSLRTLQHMGDQMLALSRHFGNLEVIEKGSSDPVYFSTPVLGLFTYGPGMIWPLTGIAFLLFFALAIMLFLKKKTSVVGVLFGILVSFGLVLLGAITAMFLWKLFSAFGFPGMPPIPGHPYMTQSFFYGFVLTVAGVSVAVASLCCKKLRVESLALGGSLVWCVLAALMSSAMPTGSYLFAVPVLCSLVGYLICTRIEEEGRRAVVVAVCSIPTLLIFLSIMPLLYLVMPYAGKLPIPALIAGLTTALLMLPLSGAMLWSMPSTRWISRGLMILGLLVLTVQAVRLGGTSARFPSHESLLYLVDMDRESAHWVSTQPAFGKWNRKYFDGERKREPMPLLFPGSDYKLLQAPTELVEVEAPSLEIVEEDVLSRRRDLSLRIDVPPNATVTEIFLDKASRVKVNGENMGGGFEKIRVFGAQQDGILVEGRFLKGASEIRVLCSTPGMPLAALGEPVPDWVIPISGQTDYIEHATVVSRTFTLPAVVEEEESAPE